MTDSEANKYNYISKYIALYYQNLILQDTASSFSEKKSTTNSKYSYEDSGNDLLLKINNVLFIFYYVFFVIILFFLLNVDMALPLKIVIIAFFATYPFFIFKVEIFFMNVVTYLFSYLFGTVYLKSDY